ncbi:tryptophan synthase alpha chain [Symbiobacterium terraclitae]|jgi:tryptophan synthase alpha chain|uniref:Tryptophan synthase alpha chain n=1 Tax=Symbiobacterium terraclitae TaxID=557451 RepID=A0ABS4JWK0_9FIRM|nr:tryptophan synthase subunit alpha [Symbiobacterium terraclitae]MBP2019291.1 tryptophan synthase alpha chain [Symbiobacterium terraclitae]
MSRIAGRFAALRSRGEKGLIAYIAAGDPSLATTRRLVHALAEAGVDMVELGLPFSDPLADGPVIQAASQRALAAGANTDNVLELVAALRADGLQIPLLIMTYYNLVLRPGVETFCRRAAAAGVDGLILPDVPMEEGDEIRPAAQEAGLDLIQFVAPTSPPDRIRRAAELARGFLYAVSLTGVTGMRASLPPQVTAMVRAVKAVTDTPVAVGFGVSRPEHVRQVTEVADAAIVGSAFVRHCGEGLPEHELISRVRILAEELKAATRPGTGLRLSAL